MTDAVEAARRILDYWDVPSGRMPRAPHSQDEVAVARALLSAVEREKGYREALTLAEPYVVLCGMISARLDTTEECERIAQVIANARGPR